jgi:uncharacterized surface protein with fasciclin (FAS1) repeats
MSLRHLLAGSAALLVILPLGAVAQTPPAEPAAASAAGGASPNLVPNGDMITTLRASPRFTILTKALDGANLTATLKTTPDITLFAPTDEAFRALPPGELAQLLAPANAQLLQKVLIYHLVHLNLDTSKIRGAKGPVETVETGKLQIDGSGPVLKVNDAVIIQADVRASNGIIQVVDKVLIPTDVSIPAAAAAASTSATVGG